MVILATIAAILISAQGGIATPLIDAQDVPAPSWIWPTRTPAANQIAYFRASFDLPDREIVASLIWVTADDGCVVYLNGEEIATVSSWRMPAYQGIRLKLRPGRNVLAIRVHNKEGSAGLIAKIRVVTTGGSTKDVITDGNWRTAVTEAEGWRSVEFDDAAWKPAYVIGEPGCEPWGLPHGLPGDWSAER